VDKKKKPFRGSKTRMVRIPLKREKNKHAVYLSAAWKKQQKENKRGGTDRGNTHRGNVVVWAGTGEKGFFPHG